jgi:hypothetical protein
MCVCNENTFLDSHGNAKVHMWHTRTDFVSEVELKLSTELVPNTATLRPVYTFQQAGWTVTVFRSAGETYMEKMVVEWIK